MATRNSNFRLSKSTKRGLANILDPHKRGAWKRSMIEAEIAEQTAPVRRPKQQNQQNGSNNH